MDAKELREAVERTENVEWEVGEEAVDGRLGYLPSREVPPIEQQLGIAAQAAAAAPPAAPAYPPRVDLRATPQGNMITPIRDQGDCGSCVTFGACAAVEGTLKVEAGDPSLEPDLSEAFLFYCRAAEEGRTCEGEETGGWFPKEALDVFSRGGGAPDEECFPYTPGDQTCAACPDWKDRATTIAAWQALQNPAEMKEWIAAHGPIVASMMVYEDFQHYAGGVYRHVSGGEEGGHCICLVGYDDEAQCWIGKNSWGSGNWGEAGFFRIGYGECGIDSGALGVEGVRAP